MSITASFQTSKWKIYRKEIFCCVICLVEYLTGKDFSTPFKLNRSDFDDLHVLFSDMVLEVMSGNSLGQNQMVIIDDNMYYQSMRYEYFQLARKCTYEPAFIAVCDTNSASFSCSIANCFCFQYRHHRILAALFPNGCNDSCGSKYWKK